DPTITKSTMSLGRKRTAGRRVSCSTSASPVRFGIVEAERRLETRLMLEPDKVPTSVVFVAAPFRHRESPDNGVEAHRLEELALLDRLQYINLLVDDQRSKRGDAGLLRSCACIQVSDAVDVRLLLWRVEARQRPVDEIDRAAFRRTRSPVYGRQNAGGYRLCAVRLGRGQDR